MSLESQRVGAAGRFRGTLLGCVSLYALAGGAAAVQAATPLSPAWFAQRGSAVGASAAATAAANNGLSVSPQALKTVQQSIADIAAAAKAVAAAQIVQSQARASAQAAVNSVANGLTLGGCARPVAP